MPTNALIYLFLSLFLEGFIDFIVEPSLHVCGDMIDQILEDELNSTSSTPEESIVSGKRNSIPLTRPSSAPRSSSVPAPTNHEVHTNVHSTVHILRSYLSIVVITIYMYQKCYCKLSSSFFRPVLTVRSAVTYIFLYFK